MDGMEAMELTVPVSETQPELHVPPGFPPVSDLVLRVVLPAESSVGGGLVGLVSGNGNGVNVTSTPSGEPMKRGRGRPRKADSLGRGKPRKIEQDELSPISLNPTQKNGTEFPQETGTTHQSPSLGTPTGERVKRNRSRPRRYESPAPSSLTPTQKQGTGSPRGTAKKEHLDSLDEPLKNSRRKKNKTDEALSPISSTTPVPSSLVPSQKRGRQCRSGSGKMQLLRSLGALGASNGEVTGVQSRILLEEKAADAPASATAMGEHVGIGSEEPTDISASATKLDQSVSLVATDEARETITREASTLHFPKVNSPSVKEISVSTDARTLKTSAVEALNEKSNSEPFGGLNLPLNQSGYNLEVVGNVPPEFKVVYEKIAARYGRLDRYLPGYLPQTYDALTKELLETISVMMQTKPSELSIVAVSQWENIVKFAADAKFNVGWLSGILARMREFISGNAVPAEQVERQADVVENLKKEVASACERLTLARQVVEVLGKEAFDTSSRLEVARSELETLKSRQVSANFFGDLE